jgi:signal-transduction protein with cAMP-binding, CBS, and nucleotidyltransferase domain
MEMFEYHDPAGAKSVSGSQPRTDGLAEFGPEEWAALREFAAERRYKPGAVILPAADPEPGLHIVLEGEVQLEGGGGEANLGPGGMFGISRFFDPALKDIAAATRTGTAVLVLTQAGLTRMAAWRPRAGVLLLGALGTMLSRQLQDSGRIF